jgi:glycosyltransferase involved in cell wall biosynthesis
MVGFSDHPHGLIAGSDIVILCSEKEGIPRVLMEAMALGKPVVATDVIGTRELVVDGETGFLVPVGKIDMMAEKIQLLAYDVDMRVKMGAAGQHRVREHYDEKKIVDYLHEFYIREAGRRQ